MGELKTTPFMAGLNGSHAQELVAFFVGMFLQERISKCPSEKVQVKNKQNKHHKVSRYFVNLE